MEMSSQSVNNTYTAHNKYNINLLVSLTQNHFNSNHYNISVTIKCISML